VAGLGLAPGKGRGAAVTAVTVAAQACAQGDTKPYLSTVCRRLGLSMPTFSRDCPRAEGIGERQLTAMYAILHDRWRVLIAVDDLNSNLVRLGDVQGVWDGRAT
jgi:hypothetical protein